MGLHYENLKSDSFEFDIDSKKDSKKKISLNYNLFSEDKKDNIGYIEGYISEGNVFISVVRIYPNFQNKGFGFEAFKKVFQELNAENNITKICGSWHKDEEFSECECGMSTNLKIFKEESKENTNQFECAFKTPTGKWAKKLGFDNCTVLLDSDTTVEVVFTKNEKRTNS
jgi:hypothetical protein